MYIDSIKNEKLQFVGKEPVMHLGQGFLLFYMGHDWHVQPWNWTSNFSDVFMHGFRKYTGTIYAVQGMYIYLYKDGYSYCIV